MLLQYFYHTNYSKTAAVAGKSNQHIICIIFKPYKAYFLLSLELFGFTYSHWYISLCQKWKDNKSALAKVLILHFEIGKRVDPQSQKSYQKREEDMKD